MKLTNRQAVLLFALLLVVIGMVFTHTHVSSEDSRFTVYGTMRCGYTVKMLDHLKKIGTSYEFVDVSLPAGDAAFKEATRGKNIRGIPFSVDHETGEEIAGFREIIL